MATKTQRRIDGDVLLVGSLPFDDARSAFKSAGEGLGTLASGLPDGEQNERKFWINYLPQYIYSNHPDLEQTHDLELGSATNQPEKSDEYRPGAAPAYRVSFTVKEGVDELEFDLGYGRFAVESWKSFKELRDSGVIAPETRFQVSIPATVSAVDAFFDTERDRELARKAYHAAIRKNIGEILEVVPPDDLQIQLDFCTELIDIAIGDETYWSWYPARTEAEKIDFTLGHLSDLADVVPEEVPLGIHWCYGTWGGWPMVDLEDLGLCVKLSNMFVKMANRKIDFVHMPVTETAEDSFYSPLADLDIGDTKVYLGMVHFHEESHDAFEARMKTAKKYLDDFGVAAVCGYGRADASEAGDIFAMHRECAAMINA